MGHKWANSAQASGSTRGRQRGGRLDIGPGVGKQLSKRESFRGWAPPARCSAVDKRWVDIGPPLGH
eukprot:173237-Lingulodinium_polyedra.AAC.1